MPQLFTVELDYRGTYQTEIEADTAADALKQAKIELEMDCGDGSHTASEITSFQVFGQDMKPCDVKSL